MGFSRKICVIFINIVWFNLFLSQFSPIIYGFWVIRKWYTIAAFYWFRLLLTAETGSVKPVFLQSFILKNLKTDHWFSFFPVQSWSGLGFFVVLSSTT